MDKKIVIIGHGDIARSMAHFPGVVGYVHVDNLHNILNPLTGKFMEKVDSNKHLGVIGIGKPRYKEERANQWESHGYGLTTLIHPSSYIDPRVKIGKGSSIWPFAFVDGDTMIGDCSMIGAHTNIHYASIGDCCHITMHVRILPKSRLQDKSFIGVGATVLENIIIGEGAVVGANSTASRNVPSRNLFYEVGERKQKMLPDGVDYPLTNAEKYDLEED